jgi:hypothetical protein
MHLPILLTGFAMSKESKVVKFTPATFGSNFDQKSNNYLSEPEHSIRFLPDWYRRLSRFQKSNNISKLHPVNDRGTDGSAAGTKLCMPFFDTLAAGYMYKLDYDVHVDLDKDGFPTITWDGEAMIIDKRNMIDVPVPTAHHPLHFGWKVNWYCETPPGYSMLITHPMNRHDLPFTTLSGIIDTDKWHTPVFTAFFLKRNFIGTIPKGTPIFQMVPIKRDDWDLEIDYSEKSIEENKIKEERRRISIFAYYKNYIWQRKNYRKGISDGLQSDDA